MKEGKEGLEEKLKEKDKVSGKVFHADLVGTLNILRVGAKILKLDFHENRRILFFKLCGKVTPESLLGIGGSNNGSSLEAVKSNHLSTFCP